MTDKGPVNTSAHEIATGGEEDKGTGGEGPKAEEERDLQEAIKMSQA